MNFYYFLPITVLCAIFYDLTGVSPSSVQFFTVHLTESVSSYDKNLFGQFELHQGKNASSVFLYYFDVMCINIL